MFVRNAWYVAGWSSEIDETLQRVTVIGQHLVLFRTSDGQVRALEDRCPHRSLPLSCGRLIDDTVQCGYHGMTFDAEGRCVRIPGQTSIPATAYVTAYPVHEKNQIVFVWMGDTQYARIEDIFDLPEFHDASWCAHQGDALHLAANYLNVAENLVDPAHVSFVHPTTLGNASSEDVPVHVDTDSDVLVAWRWIRDAPAVGFFREFGGFTGHVDRWHYYYLHLPCTAVIDFGSADSSLHLKEEQRDQGLRILALHFLTPVDEHRTIDRWMHIRNAAIDDPSASEKMNALFRVAFAEDQAILEAIELEERRAGPKRRPIRLAVDRGPLVYRQRIYQRINAESVTTPATVPQGMTV